VSTVRAKIPFRITPDGKLHWDTVKGVGPNCTKVIEEIGRQIQIETVGAATEDMHVEPVVVEEEQTVEQ
jgi:hypothetical protein